MFNRKLKQRIKMLEKELQASKEDHKTHQLIIDSYRKDVQELKRVLEASEKEIGELKSKIARKEQPRGLDGRFASKASKKREFKVGDRVKIVDDFNEEKEGNNQPVFISSMRPAIGKVGVVEVITSWPNVRFPGMDLWAFHPDWLEHVE